nr:MAG TPA: hypothetical protein [Caudoviricetes sp.]
MLKHRRPCIPANTGLFRKVFSCFDVMCPLYAVNLI